MTNTTTTIKNTEETADKTGWTWRLSYCKKYPAKWGWPKDTCHASFSMMRAAPLGKLGMSAVHISAEIAFTARRPQAAAEKILKALNAGADPLSFHGQEIN